MWSGGHTFSGLPPLSSPTLDSGWLFLTPPGLDGGCARLRPQTRLCSGLSPSWISSVLHICTDCCLMLMATRDLIQRSRNIHLLAPHFGSKVKSQTVDFFFFLPKPGFLTSLPVSVIRHPDLPVPHVRFPGATCDPAVHLTAGISLHPETSEPPPLLPLVEPLPPLMWTKTGDLCGHMNSIHGLFSTQSSLKADVTSLFRTLSSFPSHLKDKLRAS